MDVFARNFEISTDLDTSQATTMGQRLRPYATAPQLPST